MRRDKRSAIIDADIYDEVGEDQPQVKSQSHSASKEMVRTARLSDFTPVVIEVTPKLPRKQRADTQKEQSEKKFESSITDFEHFKSV